jgi:hypothetical protein
MWTEWETLNLRDLNQPVFCLIRDNQMLYLWVVIEFVALFTVYYKHKYIYDSTNILKQVLVLCLYIINPFECCII